MRDTINQILDLVVELCAPLPSVAHFITQNRTIAVVIAACTAFLLISIIVETFVSGVREIRENHLKSKVKKFFGISDLSRFDVSIMGKAGTKYFNQNGTNAFELNVPYWKRRKEDGSKKETIFNKVIYPDSMLWLHAGRKVYVLRTSDPWEMLFLVHMLRDSGQEIEPCQQELDKQERLARERKSVDEQIEEIIVDMGGSTASFVELCREKLTSIGCTVADAPRNNFGADLFLHWKGKACVAKCLLTSRKTVTGAEAIRQFKQRSADLFTDSCMVITTGHVTVAAAGYARDNDVELICDEKFTNLFTERKEIAPGKEFMAWELNREDLNEIFQDVL